MFVNRIPLDNELRWVVFVGLAVGLGLNFSGRYRLANLAIILCMFMVVYLSAAAYPEIESTRLFGILVWLTIPLVISTILCEMTAVLVISVGNFLFMLIFPWWMASISYELMGSSLEYVGILSVILIFTAYQRSQIEQDRRRDVEESEQRLRLALDSAQMSTWHWMIETDTLTWSNEGYQIWGKYGQQPPNSYQAYLQMVHPHDLIRINKAVDALLGSVAEEWFEARHRVKRPYGQWAWLETKGHVL
ncbi:MAG: PAS domain-containing protein, partial [Anaerolineales bacterium]|nr:PAS domain-containing protein [Anaerolineales bacterium]